MSGWAGAPPPAPAPFSFKALRERAAASAAGPYRAEPSRLPDSLKKLSYDQYQMIRFKPAAGPWQEAKIPFALQFFHPGFLYHDQVLIHLIEGQKVKDFHFSPTQFEYGTNPVPKSLPPGLGFAGLRILYPVNLPTKMDEVASFLGASYFRLLGKGQRYGASARALAIDTAEPTGEEFPRFTEFWIEQPGPGVPCVRFFALLDSPSVTGAYEFLLTPGTVTTLDVTAHIFLRKEVRKIGLAALTSMFLVGANRTRFVPDYRPEIHDSDGLLLHTAAREWLWRPLINPQRTFHLSQFPGDNVKGFGLLQRHRHFGDYQDLGARYDLRPDLWVRPGKAWGPGKVELVEIPTPNEFNDNIVAYWIPREKATAGREFHLTYAISASLDDPARPALLGAQSTRIDPPQGDKLPRFFIDFMGSPPLTLTSNATVVAKVTASRGETRNLIVQTNDVTGGWRVFFDLAAPGNEPVELRAVLKGSEQALSETWVYQWLP